MKNLIKLVLILPIIFLFANCKNNQTNQQVNAVDTATIKAEIEQILKVQDDALAQHNEEGNKKMQSTCMDSLLYVGNFERLMFSAYGYSHDMAFGWIERPHDKIFRFYTNSVIVSTIYKSYYLQDADTIFFNNYNTKVFVKNNNQWKMAYLGASPLGAGYFKKNANINISPALLLKNVGVYQREPKLADTVSLVNGNLFVQGSDEKTRTALFPLNDSTFTIDGYLGKFIFRKNNAGTVIQYRYEQFDGQQLHYPKVK